MPRKFSTSFVYDFKRGDNIVLSSQTLSKLWELRDDLPVSEKWLLNKPIFLFASSLIEASLCEIFHRARFHTLEGIPRLNRKQLKSLRVTNKNDFSLYIKICRQDRILGPAISNNHIYNRLEQLRLLRNRVHIQNLEKLSPACEKAAFSDDRVIEAEKLLEFTLLYLSTHYARKHRYTDPILLPWDHKITL